MGVRKKTHGRRAAAKRPPGMKRVSGKSQKAKAADTPPLLHSEHTIAAVHAREILDSRGNPTVEAEVRFSGGAVGRAAVPSGASRGRHEAVELRDNTASFRGMGVLRAVANVNVAIARALKGKDGCNQSLVDATLIALDGTPNKARLGANAILAVSIAASRAAASFSEIEHYEYLCRLTGEQPLLPLPFCNVINGGRHASGALKFQEFMIVPTGATTFSEATEMVVMVDRMLKDLLTERYGAVATHVGDEGGFAPPIDTPEEALDLLMQAIRRCRYQKEMALAMDPAASELYNGGRYDVGANRLTPEELVHYWQDLLRRHPIVSLEDPFDQDDYLSWHMLMDDLRKARLPVQLVGDDLTATNPVRIRKAVDEHLCNTLLLKPNQIGTLTEALDAAKMAKQAGWNIMVSHRSGETEDAFIADLAVALGCGQIKLGAPCRSDRTSKYNQLLRIEDHLSKRSRLARLRLPG